jgi:soluble lytic murein transglycosylase-like protein
VVVLIKEEEMIRLNVDLRKAIEEKALKYDVSPDLIEAFVITESSGQAQAKRYEPNFYAKYVREGNYPDELKKELATSWGLMQVMGLVAWERGLRYKIKETLCTVDGGLEYGIKHFMRFLNKYGNWDDAIASYNAGSPRKGKDGRYVNQNYVDKVRKYYNELTS